MKKIKNFKIHHRLRDVVRLYKNTTQAAEVSPETEQAIQKEIMRVEKLMTPAAVYDTLPKDKLDQSLAFAAPDKWVAASCYIVTIGSAIEQELRQVQQAGDENAGRILHAIAVAALDQAGSFIRRLIAGEADDEECELEGGTPLNDPAQLNTVLPLLTSDKIGVQGGENGAVQPLYTSTGIIYWLPAKKRK
jgi:hypothetical protein